MFVTAKLEDAILVAEYREDMDQDPIPDLNHRPHMWHVVVTDAFTLTAKTGKWNNTQMAAVMALMLGGGEEGFPEHVTQALYKIATPLFKGWVNDVRPIP